jgi:Domain of unknown function (DUF4394)/Lamin Tail Domain
MKRLLHLSFVWSAALLCGLVLAAAQTARAQTTIIYGVTTTNNLVSFSSASPGTTILNVPISGLQSNDVVFDIDFRPANGQLYALGGAGSTGHLYTISLAPGTVGAATLVATLAADPTDTTNPYVGLSGAAFAIDFNPVADRLRVVSDTHQNLRVNPANGLVTTDDPLAYAAGDLNAGHDPHVLGIAYTNSFAGATNTTLYDIDANFDFLAIQNPPNNGTLTSVGPFGVDTASGAFDIATGLDGTTNTAYAVFFTSTFATNLYTINLNTGAVMLVGAAPPTSGGIWGIATPEPVRGLIISEFRFRGPGGAADEFVEIANPTTTSVTLISPEPGAAGWSIGGLQSAGNGSNLVLTIPNGTIIPPGGHYLAATNTYSLTGYATRDNATDFSTNISDNTGIGLFTTNVTANYSAATRVDSVAFTGAGTARPLYIEGTGLAPIATTAGANDQFSFVRKMTTGLPQDSDNNLNDFVLISTSGQVGTTSPTAAALGAPGPENTQSPIQRNAQIKASLVDTGQSSTASPNRSRDTTPYLDVLTPSSPTGVTAGVPNSTYGGGTLSIQRRFTNNTGATITRLRFRVVDITTLNSPGAGATQADLRWLTSNGVARAPVGVTLQGITIEQPPTQQFGAALNSSGAVTLSGGALAPGASVDVQFLLGVTQGGSFRYLVNVEVLPAPPGFAGSTKIDTIKSARVVKQ